MAGVLAEAHTEGGGEAKNPQTELRHMIWCCQDHPSCSNLSTTLLHHGAWHSAATSWCPPQ